MFSPQFSPALALRMLLFGLVAIFVEFASPLGLSAVHTVCTQKSSWSAWIKKGNNQQLPIAAREEAYRKAQRLCPKDPTAYHDVAILLLQQENYDAALHWIRQGLVVAPHDPDLELALGVALLSAGHPEAAMQSLNTLSPSPKSEFYLGMVHRALRDHEAARKAFSKSIAMGNEDPYVFYELIEQDRALHDEKQGLSDFRTFYKRFPHSAWLHLLLGNAYSSRHDSAGAESEYRQAAQLDPKLPLVHFNLGRIAFNRGRYSEALRDFQYEITVDPTFGQAYLYAGTSLRRLEKNRQAIPYLKQAVARDPNLALAYRELAVAQIQAKQRQAARLTLFEGERRFPKEAAFPAQLVRLLRELGDVREASAQSKLAEALSRQSNVQLSTHPDPPRVSVAHSADSEAVKKLQECIARRDARCASAELGRMDGAKLDSNTKYLSLKAQALSLARQDKPALAAIRRAIKLDPHRSEFFLIQGLIQQRMGNQRAAIKSFLEVEQLRPGFEPPVYYLGMSFFMLGYDDNDNANYDRAARHFKMALELYPSDDRAEFMLGVVNSVEFNLSEAQKDFEAALKLNPGNPYYHLHYGLLLRRTGHLVESEQQMEIAKKLDPSYARTYLHLGSVEAQMGKYNQARAQLETALRLDPHLSSAYYALGRVYFHLGLRSKSLEAIQKFQKMKTQEGKITDPIGASINAVAARTNHR